MSKINKQTRILKKLITINVICILFSGAGFTLHAQEFTENEVKAGYLYNFTKFVTWPENTFATESSTFIIGVYKDDAFASIIENVLKNRKVLNRNWVVFRYQVPKDIEKCHMLFVSNASQVEIKTILLKTQEQPVLIVGNNIEDFCELGGIINLAGKYSKKRFHINNEAAHRVGLVISSKLLALAKIVKEDEIKF